MIFNFKKVASVLTSAAMIGSTVALAAAAAFPAPYVQGGSSDVAIVYGNSLDLVAASDIQSVLATELAKQTASSTSGSTTTVSDGDSIKLEKPSDKLNLRDIASTVFGTTIDDDDLPDLLADGVYTNDENTEYDYDQKITLGGGLQVNFFSDSDYKSKEPSVGINLSSSHVVLNYTLNFNDLAASDVTSGDLVDFETTTLHLLGKNYFILDANNATNIKLTLLDSATSSIVGEGETVSLVAGGKTYETKINFIGSSEVQLDVNGEVTNSLAEGGTQRLSDGTYVGIKDILVQDYAGGTKKVEFSIGSGKLELTSGSAVKLNDDTVSEIVARIPHTTGASNKERLSQITLEWKTDEDAFVTPSQEVVMPAFGAVKFLMGSFVQPKQEVVKVDNSGSDVIEVTLPLKDGEVTVPILQANSSGEFVRIGSDSDDLLLTSKDRTGLLFNESVHDWIPASWNTTQDAESYLLRFASFVEDSGVNKTTIQKMTPSGWSIVCNERSDSGGSTPTCDIGSLTLTLNSINAKSSTGGKYVNFTGNAGSSFNTLYTKEGLKVALPYVDYSTATANGAINFTDNVTAHPAGHSSNTFSLFFTEEDKDGNLGIGSTINVTIDDQSDGDLEVSSADAGTAETFKELEDDNNIVGMTESDLATKFRRIGSSSVQREAEITYAGSQSYAEIYLTAPSASVTGGSATSGSAKELGSVIVQDSEIASVSSKNIIAVGGSCINTAAAKLIGSDTPLCGADFTAKTGVSSGQFLIETWQSPWNANKVATLVAGFNAGDTTNAAKYLTTKMPDTAAGKKFIGTSATEASLVTA